MKWTRPQGLQSQAETERQYGKIWKRLRATQKKISMKIILVCLSLPFDISGGSEMGPRESWLLAFMSFCNAIFSNGAGRQQYEPVLHLQVGSNISLHFFPSPNSGLLPQKKQVASWGGRDLCAHSWDTRPDNNHWMCLRIEYMETHMHTYMYTQKHKHAHTRTFTYIGTFNWTF